MSNRKSFVFYYDWRYPLQMLNDEEKGKLLMALLDYSETGVLPENMPNVLKMAFSFMQAQLDRDREKYEKRCKLNRDIGVTGGRPPKAKSV